MSVPAWLERLKTRWHLTSFYQVIVILVVFACTGFTVLFLKRPILHFLAGSKGDTVLATTLYYIFILPLYNLVLLTYGFVLGQFNFFWNFEKRMFTRIKSMFNKK